MVENPHANKTHMCSAHLQDALQLAKGGKTMAKAKLADADLSWAMERQLQFTIFMCCSPSFHFARKQATSPATKPASLSNCFGDDNGLAPTKVLEQNFSLAIVSWRYPACARAEPLGRAGRTTSGLSRAEPLGNNSTLLTF